ncbi:low molecular weight protein-tyrosine-phosphatase [Maritimibacter sp. HL-12]|uniref:low molecular weight protein-tyrosine-phosphatase n=1 Tax=Maritimibacter sp. HL-12 TaxID=1162418 RepID=UPI000A0EFE43|nr:low molecular weight protein-tyrosine-phosphatase [Maritimibacter sp. HL-12]SMH50053.1 protein-tyrosine phosphatase [Maritimibacter sp. HL-12]
MTRAILFVCLGNICRSPSAEAVVRARADGLSLSLDSAGTGDWHVGEPPCPGMVRAAAARGIDLSGLRARQIEPEDFARFDLIIGMDPSNMEDIEALRPPGTSTPARLFTDYAPETGASHIPDAYFTRDYEGALDLIEACAEGLLREIAPR